MRAPTREALDDEQHRPAGKAHFRAIWGGGATADGLAAIANGNSTEASD